MPELPEVETIRRTLAPSVVGRRIESLRYRAPRAALGDPLEMASRIQGQRILSLRRIGKRLLFDLDCGLIDVHLRMTGKLLMNGMPDAYTRAVLEFDQGTLLFQDVRQFGFLVWREADPAQGADMLSVSDQEFLRVLRGRRGRIKPVLLDQKVFAGLGNIYVDEALFRAGIHPMAAASKVASGRILRLYREIRCVLDEAIAAGGSSISDYVDAAGRMGSFQKAHRVYGRGGEACVTCGAILKRIVVGQRGTTLCPGCQRR